MRRRTTGAALGAALAWGLLGILPARPVAAQATRTAPSPDADDLAASTAVLNEGPEERPEEDEDGADDGDLFEISATTLVTARGGQPETNLVLDESGWRTEDLLRPRRELLYPSLWVSMYAEVATWDWLLFRGLIDTREIRDGGTLQPPIDGISMGGQSAEQELADGAMVREVSALFAFDAFSLEVGRFRAAVADGLVYKDFGAGVRMRFDLEKWGVGPFDLELLATAIGQRTGNLENNGVLSLQLDWNLGTFETVSFLMALSEDQNGEVSEVLRSAYAERLLADQQQLNALFLQEEGGGSMGYLGVMAHIVTTDYAVLDLRLVLLGGSVKLSVPLEELLSPDDALEGRETEVVLRGVAADAALRYSLGEHFDLAGFAFFLSGDEPPRGGENDRYEAFIGLGPLWDWTGLFFSGGINQGLYPNRAAGGGVNGRGVFGLGPGFEASNETFEAEGRAIILTSPVDPPEEPLGGGGKLYGVELNLIGRARASDWLSFGLELDLFLPGRFFPHRDPAYLALAMMTLSNAE